jgi:hypothetical protein
MCTARDVPEGSRTGFCEPCDTKRRNETYKEKQTAAFE